MRFQVSAECCESFVRTDVRGETIPDSRSCRMKTLSTKWDVTRVMERRLAEADRRVLHGVCHWTRLARYGRLPVYIALWVIVANLNLIRSWTGNHCSWLGVARLEIRLAWHTFIKHFNLQSAENNAVWIRLVPPHSWFCIWIFVLSDYLFGS